MDNQVTAVFGPEGGALLALFQTVGYPGLMLWVGWRVWNWYTAVRWPQEREDAKARHIESIQHQREWYDLMRQNVVGIEKLLLIQTLAFPEHAKRVLDTFAKGASNA